MSPGKNGVHILGNGKPVVSGLVPPDPASENGLGLELAPGRSGRGFVIVLLFFLVTLTLALVVLFRQWRGQYQELAAYGSDRVATAIDPLRMKVPSAITPSGWEGVINQVHGLLVDLTASGALDLKQMRSLRHEIQERINGVRPETSAEALAGLWSALEDQAGPILTGRPRSGLASLIHPLDGLDPPDLTAEMWALARVQTRAMLMALGTSQPLPKPERENLQSLIQSRIQTSSAQTARADMGAIWEIVRSESSLPAGFSQSVLDAPPPEAPVDSSSPASP